jgi:hypothetical protein
MPGPMDEKQWDGVGFADTPLVDYLKHVAHRGGRLWTQARRETLGARTSAAGAT